MQEIIYPSPYIASLLNVPQFYDNMVTIILTISKLTGIIRRKKQETGTGFYFGWIGLLDASSKMK